MKKHLLLFFAFIFTLTSCIKENNFTFKNSIFGIDMVALNTVTGDTATSPLALKGMNGENIFELSNVLKASPGDLIKFSYKPKENFEYANLYLVDPDTMVILDKENPTAEWIVPESILNDNIIIAVTSSIVKSRTHYDIYDAQSFFMFIPNPKNTVELYQTSYILNSHTSVKIEGNNVSYLDWESQDDFVTSVSRNSILVGNFVGSTTIIGDNGMTIDVTVEPLYHLYENPHLDWAISMTEFQNKYGAAPKINENTLVYFDHSNETNNENALMTTYTFENDALYNVMVVLSEDVAYTDLEEYLDERFLFLDDIFEEGIEATYYIHGCGKGEELKADYIVLQSQHEKNLTVLYVDYDQLSRSESSDSLLKTIKTNKENMNVFLHYIEH